MNHISKLEQELLELRARNEVRLKEAKERMGTKYLLHPDNRVKRIKTESNRNKPQGEGV